MNVNEDAAAQHAVLDAHAEKQLRFNLPYTLKEYADGQRAIRNRIRKYLNTTSKYLGNGYRR